MYIAIVCKPGCDIINLEINLIFLIKSFFSAWPKSQDKNLNILRTKTAIKIKKNIFHESMTVAQYLLDNSVAPEGKL